MGGYRCKIRADLRIVDMREPRVTKVLEKSVEYQCSVHRNIERLRSRRKQLHLETHLGVLYSQSPSYGVLAIACVLEERVEKLNIQNHGQVGSPVLMRGRIEIRLSYPVVKCNELGRQPS